jgi:predicted porin
LAAPLVAAVAATAATGSKVETLGSNEVPAITADKTHISLNTLFANGPLVAGLGYEQNRVGDTITQLYGNYDLGVAKLFASTATIKGGTAANRVGVTFASIGAGVNSGAMATPAGVAADGKITNTTIGASIPMGTTTLRAGYSSWNGNGATGQARDNKLGLGAKYDLSKRTFVYTDLASQTRKNNTGTRPDRDNTSIRSLDLGVAHSF